ncbi:MAG: hypothetical protein ABEJ28_08405 [Salinigranum sp.]
MAQTSRSSRVRTVTGALGDYVNHENVLVRFVSLWSILFALFLVTWSVSYAVLPEGLLLSTNSARTPGGYAGSVPAEFLTIFAINLAGCVVIAAANTLRSIRTPAGYVVVASVWLQGAVTWGTNSLAIEAGRLAPSVSVLVGRSGLYELTAYVAVAVATRELVVWHQRSGPRWREEFERRYSPREWHLSRGEWAVLLAGILLLAAANLREAVLIGRALG